MVYTSLYTRVVHSLVHLPVYPVVHSLVHLSYLRVVYMQGVHLSYLRVVYGRHVARTIPVLWEIGRHVARTIPFFGRMWVISVRLMPETQ